MKIAKYIKKPYKYITLLWGIPASGKTTWANKQSLPKVEMDVIQLREKDQVNILLSIGEEVAKVLQDEKYVIIDGLITTNQQAKAIIDHLSSILPYKLIFKIVWWKADRKASLHNDKGRRSLSCEMTIKNIKFEKPNASLLNISNLKNIQEMKVMVYSDAVKFWNAQSAPSNKKLTSSSWSLGGSSGNPYDDKVTYFSGEPAVEFEEFDDLLLKINPSITYLQYSKLKRVSCHTEETPRHDYYGGSESTARYVCDLDKLYNALVEMNLIKGNEREGE